MCKRKCRACVQAPGGGGWRGGRGSATPSPAGRRCRGPAAPGAACRSRGGFAASASPQNMAPGSAPLPRVPAAPAPVLRARPAFSSLDPAQFGAVSYQLTGKPSKRGDQPCQGVSPTGGCLGHGGGELGTSCLTAVPSPWLPGGHPAPWGLGGAGTWGGHCSPCPRRSPTCAQHRPTLQSHLLPHVFFIQLVALPLPLGIFPFF